MHDTLPFGAHLTTPRLGYAHHGIYVGSGRVIHYAGLKRLWCRGPIEEVSLEQFTLGRALHVAISAEPRFSGAACAARARSRLGENRYRLWSNNCEHFAQWCTSGTSRSAQVEAWKARIGRLLDVLGTASAWSAPCARAYPV